MSDSFLQLINVSKRFDNVIALDKVNLKISKSEIFSLLGSSGCGKSTLLRIIAGLKSLMKVAFYLREKILQSFPHMSDH